MTDKDKIIKTDDPVEFDMDFDEALERLSTTEPTEIIDVAKEKITVESIDTLVDAFEEQSQTTEEGREFWYARDLQDLFEYGEWRNFLTVIERAQAACEQGGNNTMDHFVAANKMVSVGSGAEREITDYMLSRYACYLTAQNADARKKPVAFAQTYFAIQTRRQELADEAKGTTLPTTEDEKRIYLRNQIAEHNKYLSSAAKGAGVTTPQEFAIFHSKGYQGLYGMNKGQIQRHKGLKSKEQILDRMGSTELAANFFRVTQTEEKLRKENVQGKDAAYETHYVVGKQVREAMLNIGHYILV
jgi:DNA-damage-inducible protein D